MKPCRQRSILNDSWRCHNRGWVFGRCVEHALDRLRWDWRRGRVYASLDLGNLNRPYVQIDDEHPRKWAALSWGNGNSDPVWSVQVPLRRAAIGGTAE